MTTENEGTVIVGGFSDIEDDDPSGNKLKWFCAPDSWKPASGAREGKDGSWAVGGPSNNILTVFPPAKKDFWRKTYYEPMLVKDDGPFLYKSLPCQEYFTVRTKFDLTATCQFDQAGLCIRYDSEHWIKAGIEVVDGLPRLSTVVTNAYSNWSTQPWPHYAKDENNNSVQIRDMEICIHCRGSSFVVEAKMPDWEFIRIAHLSMPASTGKDTFGAGVFACCPEEQRGGCAVFTEFEIRKGSHMEHNADGNK